MAAVASVLPSASLQAIAMEKTSIEKGSQDRFIPINCATSLIMANPLGIYKKPGLNLTLSKTAGPAPVRGRMIN